MKKATDLKQQIQSNLEQKNIGKKELILSIVEVLYNSSSINDATYIEVKRAINKGEKNK